MKIALLHYSAPPVVGGVESVLGYHARLMVKDGNEVVILAGRGEQTHPQIPFIHLPLLDSRHPQVLSAKSDLDAGVVPRNFSGLVAEIKTSLLRSLIGVDILIAHNVCSLHKNLALTSSLHGLSGQTAAPQLILWHHDLAWTTPRYQAELHQGYPWDLLRVDWPDAFQVVVSELRQQELANLIGVPEERVRVIPNGVDLEKFFKLEPATVELIDRLDLLRAAPLLLLPVRITPRKNIELALRTLKTLREKFPEAILIVTGPLGPHNPNNVKYFDRLCQLRDDLGLTGVVHFLAEYSQEYLPDSVIADFYRLADALLFPSREEGFGIPVLESGLSGIPVFCADIPPLRKLGGDYAHYFSADADPLTVASLIESHLCKDVTYCLKVQVRRRYTWDRIYSEQIKPLLETAGGSP